MHLNHQTGVWCHCVNVCVCGCMRVSDLDNHEAKLSYQIISFLNVLFHRFMVGALVLILLLFLLLAEFTHRIWIINICRDNIVLCSIYIQHQPLTFYILKCNIHTRAHSRNSENQQIFTYCDMKRNEEWKKIKHKKLLPQYSECVFVRM